MKVLLIVNTLEFFLSHRSDIALGAVEKGFKVCVVSNMNCELPTGLDPNLELVHFPFRNGTPSIFLLFKVLGLWRIISQIKPELIHVVTIEPIILVGFIRLFVFRNLGCLFAFSGLGYVFSRGGMMTRARCWIVRLCYAIVLRGKRTHVLCQNASDELALRALVKDPRVSFSRTNGSGVDLAKYSMQQPKTGVVKVVMASRLLIDKGVLDFVAASELALVAGMPIEFVLAGKIDPKSPISITPDQLNYIIRKSPTNYVGYVSDVAKLYADAHLICYPSYYPEGVPKTLIEAAACGKPIITTNTPGCSDVVIDGFNGVLIGEKSPQQIVEKVIQFTLAPKEITRMGENSRWLAEKKFDVKNVVEEHVKIYSMLSGGLT
jgi:glycosyltransferase involved in cell wall biosynthesis